MNLRTSVQQQAKFRPWLSSGKHKGNAHFRTYKSSVRFTFNKTWENLACVCKAYYLTLPFQNNKYQMKSWNSSTIIRRIWNEDKLETYLFFEKYFGKFNETINTYRWNPSWRDEGAYLGCFNQFINKRS